MSVPAHRAPIRDAVTHTYFVGRRGPAGAEIYAVSATAVDRLRSARRDAQPDLDWRGSAGARLELSRLLIGGLTERRPSRDLETRFALYVLERLPYGGFVLDSDQLRSWLLLAGDPKDFEVPSPPRRSWVRRVRARFAAGAD